MESESSDSCREVYIEETEEEVGEMSPQEVAFRVNAGEFILKKYKCSRGSQNTDLRAYFYSSHFSLLTISFCRARHFKGVYTGFCKSEQFVVGSLKIQVTTTFYSGSVGIMDHY